MNLLYYLSLIIFLLPFFSLTQVTRFPSFCMEWHETYYMLRQSNISNNVGVTRTTTQKIFFNMIFYQFSRDKTKKKGYIQYTLWFADLILFECMCVAIILAHLIWLDLQVSGEGGGVASSVWSGPLPFLPSFQPFCEKRLFRVPEVFITRYFGRATVLTHNDAVRANYSIMRYKLFLSLCLVSAGGWDHPFHSFG